MAELSFPSILPCSPFNSFLAFLSIQSPTVAPSNLPSQLPSQQPTTLPTTAPSNLPSQLPSQQPTTLPSVAPSNLPSQLPSTSPTTFPSFAPPPPDYPVQPVITNYVCGPEVSGFILHVAPLLLVNSSISLFHDHRFTWYGAVFRRKRQTSSPPPSQRIVS